MPSLANECIPFYEAGTTITAQVATAVRGKRFVAITANRQSGPALSATSEGGNVVIGQPAAGGRVFGVAQYDGAVGSKVPVHRTPGSVVPVTAAGALTAFQEVEVDATGAVIARATGVPVGYAISAATAGQDAQISLY